MSPIIELQRRQVEVGRIRGGEKGDKGEPRKLDKWRLTSKDRALLDQAAALWGGEVREWRDEFELYTETAELPILILTGRDATTWFELWSKGGCQRRCDGVHEITTDSACLCNPDDRECKPYTRYSVILPDLTTVGSWLVSSTGWNAAIELGGLADLLRSTPPGMLLPARLLLQQRTSVQAGQTRKFAVPVIDVGVSFRTLLGGEAPQALPSGYTPLPELPTGNGVSLEQGLEAAETQTAVRTSRSAAPIPEVGSVPFGDSPIAVADEPGVTETTATSSPVTPGNSVAASTRDKPLTKAQEKQLGILVRELRDERQVITAEDLYRGVARNRSVDVTVMTDLTPGAYDTAGALHFGPLMRTLTRAEASQLIDQLKAIT